MTRLSRLGFMNTERTRLPVRRRLRSRGVPTALQAREVLCTADHGEAQEAASSLLGPAVLHVVGGQGGLQAQLNAIRMLDVTLAYLDFRAACVLSVPAAADAYTVHMTTHDSATATVEGETVEVSAFSGLVRGPGSGYEIQLGVDCPQMIVRIERAAMERHLSRILGRSLDGPIEFAASADLTCDEALRWHGAIQMLSSEALSEGSLLQRGLGARPIEELIISTLLYIQASNYSDRLRAPSTASGRPAVRRSLQYIEEHLAEPISLADLAAHSSASVRSIQVGFREDLDTTPVAYIRDRRLEQVRALLLESMPSDGLTVARAAERWGFQNPGSFAVRYRRRFGESPSETLRR